MTDHLRTVRFALGIACAIIAGLVICWDSYAEFTGRPQLTVTAAIKDVRDKYPGILVVASLLFYHLFLEK